LKLPLWIALRYLKSRKRSAFITLLTSISIVGVALGVTALLTVLAAMNGFENEVQTRIAGTDAHVVLLGDDAAGIHAPDSIVARVQRERGVVGVAAFTYTKAMVVRHGIAEGLVVKGVDLARERGVTMIGENMKPHLDRIPDGRDGGMPGIVLGRELADRIGAALGDTVVLASLAGADHGFAPKLRRFAPTGTFASGLYTYDSSFGFLSIPAAQDFFGLGEAVTGVEVKISDMFDAPAMATRLKRAAAEPGLRTNNWIELNRNLFTWMKLEKAFMFVILALIVLVAAFNIISTLFMVVNEKRRDIGVLKSLGGSRHFILTIFVCEGLLIGGVGTAIGTVTGGALIAVLKRYPLVKLPGDVYFIDRLPMHPEAGDFAAVILATLVLCLAAALYPAWRASILDPVEAIRRQT